MTQKEKLKYLIDNYPDNYKKARIEAIQIVDDKFPVICCCGKLATGLHTQSCKQFQKQVDNEIIMLLHKLLPK